jgi:hypothetical protein
MGSDEAYQRQTGRLSSMSYATSIPRVLVVKGLVVLGQRARFGTGLPGSGRKRAWVTAETAGTLYPEPEPNPDDEHHCFGYISSVSRDLRTIPLVCKTGAGAITLRLLQS